MEHTLSTPRLRLTLLEKAELGSQEFSWLHELRSDKQTTWWSIHGQSKSPADTEKFIKHCLPSPENPDAVRIAYAVHMIQEEGLRFIGLITLRSSVELSLPEANHLMPPAALDLSSTLNLELGYQYLPLAWGKGYATEALPAVFDACRALGRKVFLRAIVDAENGGSLKVMGKSGMRELGVHEWRGEKAYMAGEWRGRMVLWIWGMWLAE
ncbi:hypothetical protein HBI46_080530 [Parastagonospora nodorum]|nr:hypothetical protein HBH71_084480 [Parastagonospora nodorum]KAH5420896.1 hypothetical protein HBI46_080530 [Parastagonospora nodorum]